MNQEQAPLEVDSNDVIASLRNRIAQDAVEIAIRDASIVRLRADFDRMAEGMAEGMAQQEGGSTSD